MLSTGSKRESGRDASETTGENENKTGSQRSENVLCMMFECESADKP